MKKLIILSLISCAGYAATAQFTYKIKADSVKITNDSCNAELILENSTKATKGFLYNYGNGRTRFQKGVIKTVSGGDTLYVIGDDTLNLNGNFIKNQIASPQPANFWVLGQGILTKGGPTYVASLADNATLTSAVTASTCPQTTLSLQKSQTCNSSNLLSMFNNKGVDFNSPGAVPAGFIANTIGFNTYAGNNSTIRQSARIMHVITGLGITNTGVQGEINIRATDTANIEFVSFVARHNEILLNVTGPANSGTLIGGSVRNQSAKLEVQSTSQGFLGPRMTASQRTSISSPATGLSVYDTDSSALFVYNGGWHKLVMTHELGSSGGGTPGGSNGQVQFNNSGSFGGSSNFYWDNSNNRLGIGTSSPQYNLDINGDARVNTLPSIADRDTLLTYDPSTKQLKVTRKTVQEDGTTLSTQRGALNFNYGVTATDNSGSGRTDVNVELSNSEQFRTSDTTLSSNTNGDILWLTLGAGTWLVSGNVTVESPNNSAQRVTYKLWDGTTVYHAGEASTNAMGASTKGYVSLPVSALVVLSSSTTLKVGIISTVASVVKTTPGDNNTGTTNKATSFRAIRIK
jgi:hypothetical protein